MFVDEFVRLCEDKAPVLAHSMRREPCGPIEEAWAAAMRSHWLALPAGSAPRNLLYAVDGSGQTVELSNGYMAVIAQAFLAGADSVETRARVDLEIASCRADTTDVSSLRDIMMRRLEATLALEAAVSMARPHSSVLFLDGSIYAELSHLGPAYGWGARWGTASRRVEETLDRYVQLLSQAEQRGLWLVSVAKTARASFLSEQLRRAGTADGTLGPGDPELLVRWAPGAGYSQPVLLGSATLRGTSMAVLERLNRCPAIASAYVRLAPADDVLRVDVMASAVGKDIRLRDIEAAWLDQPEMMAGVLRQVRAAYGGRTVHNAPLYAVDKRVRLSRRMVERVYLPILGKHAHVRLDLDRSRRRFVQ